MKASIKILGLGLMFILSQSSMASTIIIMGSRTDAFFWNMVDLRQNDSLLYTKAVREKLSLDNLESGVYEMTFFSRFADRQSCTIELSENAEVKVGIPSHKFYSLDKSEISYFDELSSGDTLRIFFTQHDCFTGAPFENYAWVTKHNETFAIGYTKLIWETKSYATLSRDLTLNQTATLKHIELGKLDTRKKNCTSNPTYYFELNRSYKRHYIEDCLSLIQILESNE